MVSGEGGGVEILSFKFPAKLCLLLKEFKVNIVDNKQLLFVSFFDITSK